MPVTPSLLRVIAWMWMIVALAAYLAQFTHLLSRARAFWGA